MAKVMPFNGVRYNTDRFQEFSSLVSQPYDRISESLQRRYFQASPYNIARIIQGHLEDETLPDFEDRPDEYTRAKVYYYDWLDENILIRDEQPAFYAYEQTFAIGAQAYLRLGLIAAIELSEFDKGIILPHERTHRGPIEDRYQLLSTLKVNTEQIFMLYPDAENRVNALVRQAIDGREPAVDVVEFHENGVRQRMWPVYDPEIIAAIQAEMAPKRNLIIADGHHRYETALSYRNAMRQAHPDLPADAAVNYISVTLVSMDDPGLVVLPTHREIRNFTATSPSSVLERARAYFDVEPVSSLEACLAAVDMNPDGHAFGFYGGKDTGFYVLTLANDALVDSLLNGSHTHAWKSLAVSIVHKVLLEQIAEVPVQGIEDKTMIRYHRDARQPVVNVDSGEGNFVFFLKSTQMDEIKACAAAGEKMPQKSTDFYPKVISGLAMLPVGLTERLQNPDPVPDQLPADQRRDVSAVLIAK